MDIKTAILEERVELWLYREQVVRPVSGFVIKEYLRKNPKLFSACARTAHLRAIQSEGCDFFRQYFAGKVLLGMSIYDDFMSCLFEKENQLVASWYWAGYCIDKTFPTLLVKPN